MIKKISIVLLVLSSVCMQSTQVQAALISFAPSSQSVGLGDPVTVDLRISGLGDDILTAFDLDIGFDDSILGFQSFTFGTGLDVGFFGTINGVFDSGGTVNVFELSFDDDQDLKDFQPNDFILGTFDFSTLSVGTSALSIAVFGLAGELGSSLDADVQSGSITVTAPAAVPVPAAIWLFGTGLIGLIGFSKRRKAFVGP